MKKFLMAIMLSATALFAGGDIAPVEQPIVTDIKPYYVGVGVTAVQTYVNGQSKWFTDNDMAETGGGLALNVGYVVYSADAFTASVEGRVNKTAWNYYSEDFNVDGDVSLLTYSALVKPQYNFGDFGVYGLVGYGTSKITDFGDSVRQNGLVYGGGASYDVTDTYAITLDYVVNPAFEFANGDIENDVITLGVNYRF